MNFTCNECNDTGSRDKSGDYLDCGHCDAAMQRKSMNDFLDKLPAMGDYDAAWLVHQRALAMGMAASVEDTLNEMQPGGALHMPQEPVAHLKFWAAQSWSGNGNHDIDCGEGLEVCEAGEIGADGKPAFPVFLHAIPGALAMAPKQEAPRQWVAIKDSAWVNIVNHDHAYDGWDKDDIINHVFKLTEAKCKELNGPDAALAAANDALTDEQINTIWESLPGLKIVAGRPIDHWNHLLRHEFARQVLAAAGPDAALVKALESALAIINNEADPDEYAAPLKLIRAALSGAKGN